MEDKRNVTVNRKHKDSLFRIIFKEKKELLSLYNALYSKKIVKIPNPKYVVFYNGTEEKSDKWDLRLSDAFVHKESGGDIEVVAHMLNINYGHNKELMEKCEKLREYAILIATIRKYQEQGMDLEKAVSLALDECLKKGILTEILRKERAVIMNSILTEFDEEAYASMLRDEGFEDGREEGREETLIGTIRICKSFGVSKAEAVEKIVGELNILKEEAESYVEKYWDN